MPGTGTVTTPDIRAVIWDMGGILYPTPFELLDQLEQANGWAPGILPRGPFSPDGDPDYRKCSTGELTESKYWKRYQQASAARGYPIDLKREIDWAGLNAIIQELPDREGRQTRHLVIDEGQDMPREFYNALVNLGFDRFFVVADQNQQITEANSSRKDIQDCLGIEAADVIELRQNYRNNYPVARLAREFYTGDPASPPPEFPESVPGAVSILYYYDESRLDRIAPAILRLADRDPRQLIGVIAPSNRVRERYLEALLSVEVRLDNPRPPIETYHGEHRAEVAFDEGGILVINAQSSKGLEFDTVVLADIDEHFYRYGDPDVAKRLFYVMAARARERVFLFMKRTGRKHIETILPEDQDVLRRKEL